MISPVRQLVLEKVAARILSLRLEHPVRVGIDGVTAAGKSTFAKELAESITASGREVIATTLDGFHNPRARRYERGRGSPEGYYYDAYNYAGVVEFLLNPLGREGNRMYRAQILDLRSDQPIEAPFKEAPARSILVVDGSFALRHELRDHWDIRIYLDVDLERAEDRAATRDAGLFGSAEEARKVTRQRYVAAHRLHTSLSRPAEIAHFVICNDDPANPVITAERN